MKQTKPLKAITSLKSIHRAMKKCKQQDSRQKKVLKRGRRYILIMRLLKNQKECRKDATARNLSVKRNTVTATKLGRFVHRTVHVLDAKTSI